MANNTSRLQQWLESVWYGNGKGRLLLMPLSYLYSAVNRYQRKSHSKNQTKLDCPVIVVGNITVGGTGKTPLTIHIIKLLQQANYNPAIITRGYGGKATTWPQSVTVESDPSLVGDEAVLMASSTGVPLFAGADRLASIEQLLETHHCDVIVSDDGMQHYKMPRDIQIAVIDGKRLLGNGNCLPAGPLRESKDRLNECDLIVLNGETKVSGDVFNNAFAMNLSGQMLFNLSTLETKSLNELNGQTVQALTGIGNPMRFYSSLREAGLKVIENSFPDHYAFQKSDLNFDDASIVIMTEKDAVKCKSHIGDSKQYWCLPVTAILPNEFNIALLTKLKEIKAHSKH